MILALTTGAVSPTNTVNHQIASIIIMTRSKTGKYDTRYQRNTTIIVMLNPLTAIKWVRPERLKLFFIVSDSSSLAPIKIPHKKMASFSGYNSCIFANIHALSAQIFRSYQGVSLLPIVSREDVESWR